MTRKSILFTFALCTSVLLFGQTRINFSLEHSCSYYGESIKDDIYSFSSTQEARDIVTRILNVVGLEQNFEISAANVPNAAATIQNNKRLILYSQNFILGIKNATGTDWAGLSILAHEIGHHLNGHTIMPGGSRPDIELQADKFSGFVCAKLGAGLKEAQAAMNTLASESGSATHPPKSARLEAIAIGWNQGGGGKTTTPDAKPPVPSGPVKPSPEEQEEEENHPEVPSTTQVTIAYTGDSYGCNLPVTITIGKKTFTPTSNQFTVSGIPLGRQYYKIRGNINCPIIGGCSASGEGYLEIEEDAVFYVGWQNVSYAQCKIWLQSQ